MPGAWLEAILIAPLMSFGLAVAGILIGLISAYLTLKYRQKGKLKLVLVRKIGLISEMVDRVSSLKIEYDNKPVSENLTYVEGAIANVGNTDITNDKVFSPLVLSTKCGRFIDLSKVDKESFARSPKWSINIHDKQVVLEFDLLKKGEIMPFAGLIELTNNDTNDVRLDGRIANVTIEHQFFESKVKSLTGSIIVLGCMLPLWLLMIWFIFSPPEPSWVLYPYRYLDHETGAWYRVQIEPHSDGTIDLRAPSTGGWGRPDGFLLRRFERAADLFKRDDFEIEVADPDMKQPRQIVKSVFYAIYSIVAALVLGVVLIEWRELWVIRRVQRVAFPEAGMRGSAK